MMWLRIAAKLTRAYLQPALVYNARGISLLDGDMFAACHNNGKRHSPAPELAHCRL